MHPYCAHNSLRDVMPRHALSAHAVEEMWRYIALVGTLISMHGFNSLKCLVTRRKPADLFSVCYRSADDPQILCRSSADSLQNVCRMSAEYLQNVCKLLKSAEQSAPLIPMQCFRNCRCFADMDGYTADKKQTKCTNEIMFI